MVDIWPVLRVVAVLQILAAVVVVDKILVGLAQEETALL
jgi:hypothetical protein